MHTISGQGERKRRRGKVIKEADRNVNLHDPIGDLTAEGGAQTGRETQVSNSRSLWERNLICVEGQGRECVSFLVVGGVGADLECLL